jgi:hypothetical protein
MTILSECRGRALESRRGNLCSPTTTRKLNKSPFFGRFDDEKLAGRLCGHDREAERAGEGSGVEGMLLYETTHKHEV